MSDRGIDEQLEIEWISHAPSGRQWWVCVYTVCKQTMGAIPTSRILGQYPTLEAAQATHPKAKLSFKTKKLLEEKGA
jgi:hypothetical protein